MENEGGGEKETSWTCYYPQITVLKYNVQFPLFSSQVIVLLLQRLRGSFCRG